MKLAIILLFATCMQASANAYAQQISLSVKNSTLKHVFSEIKKQTGYSFLWDEGILRKAKPVSFTVKDASIEDVMRECLRNQPLTYTIDKRLIVVKAAAAEISDVTPVPALPADISLSGRVTNANKEPLEGVSVTVKGTHTGTTTDADGQFRLEVQPYSVLIFSRVGYNTREISIGNQTVIKVTLSSAEGRMDEVVVVGYGSQRKAELTGAVSETKGDSVIANRPVTSVAQALQGRVAGLQINPSANSKPGAGYSFNIRGVTSINGGAPLVLVNGVEMDPNLVPPDDIENITVLKDASASIYGARGAFGVILITTKKGEKSTPLQLIYTNNFSWSNPTTLPEKVDPITQIKIGGIAWENGGGTPGAYWGRDVKTWIDLYESAPKLNTYTYVNGLIYPLGNSNMIDVMTEPGFIQKHNLSVSGGSDKISYRLSAGLMGQDGVLVLDKDKFSRKNISGDISTDITKWLSLDGNINFIRSRTAFPWIPNGDNYLYSVSYNRPTFWLTGIDSASGNPWGYSPAMVALGANNYTVTDNSNIQLATSIKPFRGMEIKGRYTFRRNTGDQEDHANFYMMANPPDGRSYASTNPNSITRTASFSNFQVYEVWMQYEKRFNNMHYIKLMGGYSQEEFNGKSYYSRVQNLISDNIPSLSLGTGNTFVGDNINEWATSSLFSRLNYNYKAKYLAELIVRYDGSSRFPENDRFALFPSGLLGWRISDESFMQWSKSWLSNLKLRASYGVQGNQTILNYAYSPSMGISRANWIVGGIQPVILTPANLISSSFTWEKVNSLNFGLDFGFFTNRLNGSLEIYRRNTIGMLAPGNILPATLGTSVPETNSADLQVNGAELSVNWNDQISKKLSYRIGLNVYNLKAKITKYDNPLGLINTYNEGRLMGEIWGYVTDRLFTEDDFTTDAGGTRAYKDGIPRQDLLFSNRIPMPGDVKFADLNKDGVINYGNNTVSNPGDLKVIGNSSPQYQFGLSLGINYKRISISAFLQGVAKRDMWIGSSLVFAGAGTYDSYYKHTLDYWTPENPEAFYPRPNTQEWNRQVQTRYLQNAAYLRFKNITCSYDIPDGILNKVKLKNLKVYCSAENLFLISGLPKGIDPELGGAYTFPLQKEFSFGVNVRL
ncbi:MAG: TonB-dependent receptor [Chitinophagaceae bacterium]|nr:TonB-dependent receptor [Chitinophagaceae bacterium]